MGSPLGTATEEPRSSAGFRFLGVPVVHLWSRCHSERPVLQRRLLGRMHKRRLFEPMSESDPCADQAGGPVQGFAPVRPWRPNRAHHCFALRTI